MTHERPRIEGGGENTEGEEIIEKLTRLDQAARIESIARDPEVQKGMKAMLRLTVNTGISVADTIPGVGAVFSLGADGAKHIGQKYNLPFLDTSPAVSTFVAVVSEGAEFLAVEGAPTHLLETTLQARADWPVIKKAYARAKAVWAGRAEEISQPHITNAIKMFIK